MGHTYSRLRVGAALMAALSIAALAACSSDDNTPAPSPSAIASATPSGGASPTPGGTATATGASPTPAPGTPTASPVPAATPTPYPPIWTTLDALTCVRTFPGVPSVDRPNQWIDVTARITNPGAEPVQIGSIAPLSVTFYDGAGNLLNTTKGPIPVTQFEPGQTHTVTLKEEDPELPTATTCKISVSGPDNKPVPMGGLESAGITELALP